MLTNIIEAPARQTHVMQQAFRHALSALAEPLRPLSLPEVTAPEGIGKGLWAMVLTLLDHDVTVHWPDMSDSMRANLVFHTGVRIAEEPEKADWVVLHSDDPNTESVLDRVSIGTHESPDTATSVLMMTSHASTDVLAEGPGFENPQELKVELPESLVSRVIQNNKQYPLGFDLFLVSDHTVAGLPRSTRLMVRTE
ncbi:MAG: Alpha-D-ribose 1-methylphosphonate 5-triphosphate synthase subunit PhnH [Gammaproteobacteria bacterium]|nr:MAG: Alpha-D-ribose 1-methylphosphonate 5-triphosphate synthase subunit PhnH [Gammaproteobacteria bacterium]